MRLEGKHQYFKDIFNRSKNTKNVCKSMALKHQQRQAFLHSKQHFLPCSESDASSVTFQEVNKLPKTVQHLLSEMLFSEKMVASARQCHVLGVIYAVGTAVLLCVSDGDYVFGEVKYIFSLLGAFVLCCEKMNSEYWRHYHAYILEPSGEDWIFVKPCELVDHHSLGIYQVGGQKVVAMKYHVHI
jgi:hypothetical protein